MLTKIIKKIMNRGLSALVTFPESRKAHGQEDPNERERQHYRRAKRATQHLGTDRVARVRSAVLDLELLT